MQFFDLNVRLFLDISFSSGIDGLICLESDNESEDSGKLVSWNEEEKVCSTKAIVKETELSSRPFKSTNGKLLFSNLPSK